MMAAGARPAGPPCGTAARRRRRRDRAARARDSRAPPRARRALGQRRALQKAERGGGVELDIHGGGRSSHTIGHERRGLVHDPIDEPASGVALLEDAVRRAVAQRHVPLVAIPGRTRGRAPRLTPRHPPAPDVRQGPAQVATAPPVEAAAVGRRRARTARRSTRDARRHGQTAAAQGRRPAARTGIGGGPAIAESEGHGPRARGDVGNRGRDPGAKGLIANAPGRSVSTSTGAPKRSSPISAREARDRASTAARATAAGA